MKQRGFTIVELLIVIVVIGILAAIVIVAFNGVQDRAKETTVKSDFANFSKQLERAKIDSVDGKYPSVLTAAMGISVTKNAYLTGRNNMYYCTSTDFESYALGAVTKGTEGFVYTREDGFRAHSNVSDATTCGFVGKASGSRIGYNWNGTTSTGSWSAWTN